MRRERARAAKVMFIWGYSNERIASELNLTDSEVKGLRKEFRRGKL